MDCTICTFETSRRAGAGARVGGPVRFCGGCDSGRSFLRVSVEFCGSPWSLMCYCFTITPGRGMPPDPRKTCAPHKGAARHGLSPEVRPEPGLRGCRPRPPRPVLARRCRTARRPAGRQTGSPPPESGARHPSGTPPPGTVRRVYFAPPRRRRSPGVRGGTAPRQPPQGTHGVWPRRYAGSPALRAAAASGIADTPCSAREPFADVEARQRLPRRQGASTFGLYIYGARSVAYIV